MQHSTLLKNKSSSSSQDVETSDASLWVLTNSKRYLQANFAWMLLFTIDYDFRLLVASASSNITPVKMLRLQCDILMELASTTELFGTVFAWIVNRSLNHWTFTESTGTLDSLRADSMEEESPVGKFETSIGRTSTVAEVATVILSQRQTNPFDLITTTYYHLNKKRRFSCPNLFMLLYFIQ